MLEHFNIKGPFMFHFFELEIVWASYCFTQDLPEGEAGAIRMSDLACHFQSPRSLRHVFSV